MVSSLSETLDRIDVSSARKVLVDAFLANRDGWQVQIPTVPLDALYGTRLTGWLAERGANVCLQTGVEQLCVEEGRATGVILRTGEKVEADQVIVAVPHWLVLDLFPLECRTHPALARLSELETAPISSVHLWFDRPILLPSQTDRSAELPHAVLIDRLSQWVFNRDLLHASDSTGTRDPNLPPRSEQGYNYQVIISASRNIASCTQQDVIQHVVGELADVFPVAGEAVLLHSRLVTEHRAVFSARPGANTAGPFNSLRSPMCSWPAIGRVRAGPPLWKELFAVAIWPRKTCCGCLAARRPYCGGSSCRSVAATLVRFGQASDSVCKQPLTSPFDFFDGPQ